MPARCKPDPVPVDLDVDFGPNRAAAELTIQALQDANKLDKSDSARIATLRSLATAVDVDGMNASLWREYRAAEAALREVHDDDGDGLEQLLGSLSASMGDA